MAVWSIVPFSDVIDAARFDAEFYQPRHLQLQERVDRLDSKPLARLADVSDGNHLGISDRFTDNGVPYLRGGDLGDFFLHDIDPKYVPEDAYWGLKRSHMIPGDVLLSIVGTVGLVSLVTDEHAMLTGSCKIAIVRPKHVRPGFLAAYLASGVGQAQIERRVRGAVQQGLILPDLKDLPVPTVSDTDEETVEQTVYEAYRQLKASSALYAEAETVLLAALGVGEIDLSHQTTYTAPFSEAIAAQRLDTEFFRPKYRRVKDALRATGAELVPLDRLVTTLTNGGTPRRHDLSVGSVPFLTAEHVHDFRLDYGSDKRVLAEHHDGTLKRTRLRENDLLLTIKGRVGNAAVVEGLSGPVNINQDVGLIRLKKGVPPYYVAGFLNSPAGKALTEQMATGQINPFLGLGNVRQVLVPVVAETRMAEIGREVASVVSRAHAAATEAASLLESAKRRVEALIEEGA